MNSCQVQLFAAVGSPTDKLLSGTGLEPNNDGSNGVWRTEGGPFQQPAHALYMPAFVQYMLTFFVMK